jgi:hypothetical protein
VLTTALGLLWGLAQGVRHALEPDHLAAVSTLVAERRSARSAASYAMAWGAGHALVLLAFGGALLVLRGHVPPRIAASFELLVALMLVFLGARAVRRAFVHPAGPPFDHAHGRASHSHAGPSDHVHVSRWALARQPLVVGCIHGLAGSGALAALVMPGMPSPAAGLTYMALYGSGAALGMAALAGLAGIPLARLSRARQGLRTLLATTGVLSLLLGLAWGWTAAGAALQG